MAKALKTISLLVDHVYMPADVRSADWANAQQTQRYDAKVDGGRTKYAVHPALADFLIGRDQAVEVPDAE